MGGEDHGTIRVSVLEQMADAHLARVDDFTMQGTVLYCMLGYATLCYARMCYARMYYAVQCHAMLCYAMLCYAMLCYAMLCYAMMCYAFPIPYSPINQYILSWLPNRGEGRLRYRYR